MRKFKVVGGGTAGITLASRLAQNSSLSVAIIEAGGFYEVDNGNYSVLPGLWASEPFLTSTEIFPPQPLIDWGLVTAPQTGALNRKIHYARGKTLSGSSAINAMAYHRGTSGSYNRWASVVGDGSYTFANILPYFKKSCDFHPPDYNKRQILNATVKYDPSAFDTNGGPLEVSYSNWVDPALTWFERALVAIGLPINAKGFNSGSLTGTSWIPSTIDPRIGERSSSESSFLQQAIEDSNFFLYTQAQATKILFNSTTAYGVNVTTRDVSYAISARKEVIISSGVFHSPQLLMLSGIGPRSTLEKYAIPVLVDLPGVGQNLQDQPTFGIAHAIEIPVQRQLVQEPKAQIQLIQNATGPLSSLNGLIAFEKVPRPFRSNFSSVALESLDKLSADWPEIEYLTSTTEAPDGSSVGIIAAALSAPLSRGKVTITSSEISSPPAIDLGWYTDVANADTQVAIAAFKRIRQAFNKISNITAGPELSPGPTVQSNQEILTYIRNTSIPLYHAGATCAMGRRNDFRAVVDGHGRVYGVQNLRVVDLSAVPFVPPGHPQATVYMLAEKIAEDIRKGGSD
ncbi:MAG: hypothetical protein LQ342_005614 [Letrouitia transgressa]|nr:MAG: hypothetical protein LQ342_005614 [Letrouitia transgressa]